MKSIITKVGQLGVSLAVTVVSIVLSVLITFGVLGLTDAGEETFQIAFIISILCPALIAPLVTWYLVKLLIKINELEQKQRRLATYDELTGVMTRRAFFENFDTLKKIADRNKSDLTLAYIDIDDFKPINDNYGHTAGDKALEAFSDILKRGVRNSDVVARIGGEEFAILLPDTDVTGAYTILERLRQMVASEQLEIGGDKINLSVSIGLTHNQKGHELLVDQLVQQADKALYQAKSEGKNCIVQYA